MLAALDRIASIDGCTASDLIRKGLRDLIRTRARNPQLRRELQSFLAGLPVVPATSLRTPQQLSRFKQKMREQDTLLLDLGLVDPGTVQARNSIQPTGLRPVLVDGP